MITNLQPNEVFVFGSNLAGHHGGGAARQAHMEPDGGAGAADMDTGDDGRDRGPTMEPEYE